MAETTKLSVDYIGRIERGTDIPSLAVAVLISRALNTPLDSLLSNRKTNNKSVHALKLDRIIAEMEDRDVEYLAKLLELKNEYKSDKK